MKINKKKVMVSALAVAMGAALVGSISGTIAWYQYSTRVTAAMLGTTAGTTKNLQMKINYTGLDKNDFRTDVTSTEIAAYFDKVAESKTGDELKTVTSDKHLAPVTQLGLDKDAALGNFKGNPVYQNFDPAGWVAYKEWNVAVIPLTLQLTSKNEANKAQDIYMNDLTIVHHKANETDTGTYDLSGAIRVHVNAGGTETGAVNTLFAKSDAATVSTTTYKTLDVNNDGKMDLARTNESGDVYYDFNEPSETRTATKYGDSTKATQTAYGNKATSSAKIVSDANGVLDKTDKIKLGTLSSEGTLDVTVTIWLEGFHELTAATGNAERGESDTLGSIWDSNYIGSQFNVGMTFACDADLNAN